MLHELHVATVPFFFRSGPFLHQRWLARVLDDFEGKQEQPLPSPHIQMATGPKSVQHSLFIL